MSKRGSARKQKAMTEEETVLYLQQKALAEEEMAKRKENLLNLFLKDKLQKESRNSSVNLNKLTQQWRAMLRQARTSELRDDIGILRQTFERVIDRKDNIIQCLVEDLKEAEQQSLHSLRAHLHHMDQLLDLQRARLTSLEEQWINDLDEISEQFNVERDLIVSHLQLDSSYLDDVNCALEQYYADLDNEAQQDFTRNYHDIENRSAEAQHKLQVNLHKVVTTLWQQIQQAQNNYKPVEENQAAFEALKVKDGSSIQTIESQLKKIQKIQGTISALRARLHYIDSKHQLAVKQLRIARDEITSQAWGQKRYLSKLLSSERIHLNKVATHSWAASKKLQGIIQRGERLLRFAELCRRLETEQEKVLPFYSTTESEEGQSQETASVLEAPSETMVKAMQQYSALENFWKRYNKVLLDRHFLQYKITHLSQENEKLRIALQNYLDGMTVSIRSDAQSHLSSVLVVSSPVLKTPQITADFHKQRK